MKSRASWGSRNTNPPKDGVKKKVLVIHHSAGFGMAIDTKSEQKAVMRSFQRFHMDDPDRRWADIGYLGVVFQPYGTLRRPIAYVGRHDSQTAEFVGPFLPAAQYNRNSGTIAICVVGNFENEKVKFITKRKLTRIAKACKKKYGITHLAGHRDFGGTDCPGDNLYAALDSIAKSAGLRRM